MNIFQPKESPVYLEERKGGFFIIQIILMGIGLIATIAVNALANILPINGQTTGEISNRLPVLFTPAGYVFSIWSVIYILLIIWIIHFALQLKTEGPPGWKQTSLFIASCLFNIGWILTWHYEYFIITLVMMIGLVTVLALLYSSYPREPQDWKKRGPISVYLGWVSVALVANISYVLTYYEWDGFGLSDQLWTVATLTLATALALHFRYHYFDKIMQFVFIWAFIGIAVRLGLDELLVSAAAIFLSVVLVAGIFYLNKKKNVSLV